MTRWPLGINIGYSKKKASLGLASTEDVFTPFGLTPTSHGTSKGHIFRVEARFDDGLAWARSLPEATRRSVLATIDGPIAASGVPRTQRYVDGECQRGQCQYRCPPSSVVGGGRDLVDATYRLIAALDQHPTIMMSRAVPESAEGAVFAEVNPTLGLAWVVPVVDDWRALPSRPRAKRKLPPVVVNGRKVKAKSEYYWESGGNRIVAAALQAPHVAQLRHHEAEASLYALSVAVALLGRAGPQFSTVCIGRSDGVFHLLAPIDGTWGQERLRIGEPADASGS